MDILSVDFFLITILFFIVAIVYSSIGHAGASGYTAVMALIGVSPLFMRPTSLILNIAVGLIGFYRFNKAELIEIKKVTPFLLSSMPIAFSSSQLNLNKKYFYLALGLILLVSGLVLLQKKKMILDELKINNISWPLAIICGGIIGFLSGITGTGGAIFFTPLLLHMKWTTPKQASGLSVVFVLANSIFGLAGISQTGTFFNLNMMFLWILTVTIGALIGTHCGIFKYSSWNIQKVLSFVLILASLKLFLNAS